MEEQLSNVLLFAPEASLSLGALALFVGSLIGLPYRQIWLISLLVSATSAALGGYTLLLSGEPFFPGIYRVDLFSQLIKTGLAAGVLLVLALGRELETVRPSARVDTPLFLLLAAVGMMLLASATELLTLYVALELSAYGLYIAVVLQRRGVLGSEAGARYIVHGAVASAVTVYGISLVFGATGSTYLTQIGLELARDSSATLVLGLVLVFAGFLFKLAIFPFHFWAPDVYEAAPHQIVAFVGTVSKLAAVAIIARVSTLLFPRPSGWVELFLVLSVASMTLGNLGALVQGDLKRLLGYSAIAHGGYLMLGYAAFSELGLAAALFYGIVYLAMSHLAFVVVCAVGADGSNPSLGSLAGLYRRSPGLALMLLVATFGLGGIPPTAGFIGKWFLFTAALERGHFGLVLVAALNSTVSLYYYLQVIKAAYLLPPADASKLSLDLGLRVAGYLSLAVTLFAGIFPSPLWTLSHQAARLLVGP